jgi:hypothetical protein
LAGALLFDEKIRQRADLFWFGLQNVEIHEPQNVEIHEPQSKKQFMFLPHFWSTLWQKRSWSEHM